MSPQVTIIYLYNKITTIFISQQLKEVAIFYCQMSRIIQVKQITPISILFCFLLAPRATHTHTKRKRKKKEEEATRPIKTKKQLGPLVQRPYLTV